MKIWRRLKTLWRMLELVEWTCQYCKGAQDCSMVLWPDLRYRLICRYCYKMQSYPDHVKAFDPLVNPLVNRWRPVNWS